jgi:hypothetical protein
MIIILTHIYSFSPLKKVQAGDVILGKMFLNKNNTWSIQCIDKTSGVSSNLNVETDTLEPYAFVTLVRSSKKKTESEQIFYFFSNDI